VKAFSFGEFEEKSFLLGQLSSKAVENPRNISQKIDQPRFEEEQP